MNGEEFASFDEAWKATTELLASDPSRDISDPTLPVHRLAAIERIESERARYEAGDSVALLGAIRECACHEMPLPDWAARAFIRGYDQVLNCRAGSWDEVFGRPYPKGTHLAALRKRRLNRIRVILAVRKAREDGRAIDVSLFEAIGLSLGLGKSLAAELYYEAKKRWPLPARVVPRKPKK